MRTSRRRGLSAVRSVLPLCSGCCPAPSPGNTNSAWQSAGQRRYPLADRVAAIPLAEFLDAKGETVPPLERCYNPIVFKPNNC